MVYSLNDYEQCVECDVCSIYCQVYDVTKRESYGPLGKIRVARKIAHNEELSSEEYESIYLCTGCGRCIVNCPYLIDIPQIVRNVRVELKKRGMVPERLSRIADRIIRYSNVMGKANEDRLQLYPKDLVLNKSSTVYMPGCIATFLVPNIVKSTINVLSKCLNFKVLGDKERCCGSFLYDIGYVNEVSLLAKENTLLLEDMGIDRIILSCATCYNTYHSVYPKLFREPKYEVYHVVQVLKELIDEGRLSFKENDYVKVVYVDACYLGRYSKIYEEPRAIIKKIPNVELVEFKENRELAPCCGAIVIKPFNRDVANAIALNVLREAEKLNVDYVITACPFCTFHYLDVKRRSEVKVEVLELTEFITKRLR